MQSSRRSTASAFRSASRRSSRPDARRPLRFDRDATLLKDRAATESRRLDDLGGRCERHDDARPLADRKAPGRMAVDERIDAVEPVRREADLAVRLVDGEAQRAERQLAK